MEIVKVIAGFSIWQSVAVITLAVAFAIICLDKWKILEWVQRKMPWPFYKMASCNFCMGFWFSMIICVIFAVITGDWSKLIYPVLTAPIIRFIL